MKKSNLLALGLLVGLSSVALPYSVYAASSKTTSPANQTSASSPVDLNSASVSDLNALPGIGAATAKKIIASRPFASINDFQSKNVVSAGEFTKLQGLVTVSGSTAAAAPAAVTKASSVPKGTIASGPVDLNSASASDLNALPGIGAATAKKIIAARPFASLSDFQSKNVVSAGEFTKLQGLVTVSGSTAAAAPTVNNTTTLAAAQADSSAIPAEPTGAIDLNSATVSELIALPGIGQAKAAAIVAARPFASTNDLVTKKIVSANEFSAIGASISVSAAGGAAAATIIAAPSGTPAQRAEHSRIATCGAQWKVAKAANQIPTGQKWPQYWSACDKQLKTSNG